MMKTNYDVLILGGGPAGLSAAMTLGRIGRTALVCDDGRPRNAQAAHMNNFPSHDGLPPAEWRRLVHEDLKKYQTIDIREVSVTGLNRDGAEFIANIEDRRIRVKKVILAHGIQDRLPDIPGFQELWGKSVFHCPFCHGFEVRGQALAVFGNGEFGFHMATLISGLTSDLKLFTGGPMTVTDTQQEILKRNRIEIIESPIARLNFKESQLTSIALQDGREISREGIFMAPSFPLKLKSSIGLELGCQVTEFGTYKVDEFGRTSVAGVFAAGDIADPRRQSVLLASASGVMAASTVVQALLSEQFHA